MARVLYVGLGDSYNLWRQKVLNLVKMLPRLLDAAS